MRKEIKLLNKTIAYTIRRHKRARSVRLSVQPGGVLVVTVPYGITFWRAERFIMEKAEWVLRSVGIMEKKNANSIFARRSKREYLTHKETARALAWQRARHFAAIYGVRFGGISIRNQRTRWGSCSKKGNLNFNYKIALIPEELADYIIVHELCHLKEFNHSSAFWSLVADAIPDYKRRRKEIRNI